VGQGTIVVSDTSSTNMLVGSPALSPWTRNLILTVCPAKGAMLKLTWVHVWALLHTCIMVARMLPLVSVT
jgi:hypothetical protein